MYFRISELKYYFNSGKKEKYFQSINSAGTPSRPFEENKGRAISHSLNFKWIEIKVFLETHKNTIRNFAVGNNNSYSYMVFTIYQAMF